MATLLTCRSVTKSFSARTLFDGLSFGLSDGERTGLIGPNGSGKTTLLRICAGREQPDEGEVTLRRGLHVGYLPQEEQFPAGATVHDVLVHALPVSGSDLHEREIEAEVMLSRCGFDDPGAIVDTLSGGWRKRLAIARELIREPDLLLLDEPTNHLDVQGVLWLEELLARAPFAFLLISHDRYLLDRATNRIIELSPVYPDGYYSVDGPYGMFIEKRAEFLDAQANQEHKLAVKVRREVEYLRRGVKAQRTKGKSRVEAAGRMIEDFGELKSRNIAGANTAGIEFDATGRRTKRLLTVEGLGKSLGGRPLFRDVSLTLSPGSRVGVVGPNGCGKSTLVRILAGSEPPDAGVIRPADNLKTAVFDQHREVLAPTMTLKQAICGAGESVLFQGKYVHFIAWAKRLLFREHQLNMEVGQLSGGEHARIHLSRLMLTPADVLLLDEPTNDLDIPTLELLEETLEQFPGAVVLVTHDRYLLDRLCSEFVGLDGLGGAGMYASLDQALAAIERAQSGAARVDAEDAQRKKSAARDAKSSSQPDNRLTGAEAVELDGMEAAIHAAEAHEAGCRRGAEDPAVASDYVELQKRCDALAVATLRVRALYARWEALAAKDK